MTTQEKYTVTNVLIQKTKTDYTPTGQVWKIYGPECFTYPTGTLTTTNAGCDITTTTYDALDRPDIVTDGEGRKTKTIYFADGKVSRIIRALGTPLQQDYATYTYTQNGQEASVKDANGNLTEYFYDGFDRLNKFQLPHPSNIGQSNPADYEQYTYDNNGNMTVKRKRDGKTITSVYDALNRVITKSPQGQPSVSYTYDKVGRQTDVDFVGGGHSIQHTYDTAGRLIATNDNGRTLSYQYTDKVNRTRITWPDGYSADYAYDNLNRVTAIKENNAAILATYAYDTSGRRASITLGNGTITNYSYHNDDALNTLSHNVNGAADDVDWTYGFNKVNQLTNKIMGGGANLSLYKWEPQYAKTDAYTSNGLNQYANVAGTNLSYDLNGNLTSDGVWNYVYDTENMLLNASKAGASASYIYDPLGRRSAKTVDTVLTTFLHDGVEEIADYNSSGTLLRRYVHGPSVDEYLVMYTGTGTTNKSYFHANHQGSIIAMSDGSGNVTEQHSYDSYGNSDDLTGNPFRYTGRRLDAETGLYYYRARYYSPAIGRFLQTDPIGYGDGLNWYAYVGNDPLNGTDPTGNACFCGLKNGDRIVDLVNTMTPKERKQLAKITVTLAALPLVIPAVEAGAGLLSANTILNTGFAGATLGGGLTAFGGGSNVEIALATGFGFIGGIQVAAVKNIFARGALAIKTALLKTGFTAAATGKSPTAFEIFLTFLNEAISTVNPTAGVYIDAANNSTKNKTPSTTTTDKDETSKEFRNGGSVGCNGRATRIKCNPKPKPKPVPEE